MKNTAFKKVLATAAMLCVTGYADIAWSHSGGATTDGAGTNPSAAVLVAVTCGIGTDYLTAQIKDQSGPVAGLLLSLHLQKGSKMTSTTDSVSGDANYSPEVALSAGPGVYYMSITKTAAGARQFDASWHCMANSGEHTDTDLGVLQFQ